MPSSITRLTSLDHDRLSRLLRRACAPGPSQQRWRDELVHLVRAHLSAELTVLSEDVLAEASLGAEATALLRASSADLERLTDAVATTPVDTADLQAACDRLATELARHADALQDRVLRPLEEAVPRKEMRRLGGAYGEHRDQVLRELGDVEPPPRRLDLSRAELYELARKAGIEGRSSMSRRDLIDELMQRESSR